jgi:hypothetical protein
VPSADLGRWKYTSSGLRVSSTNEHADEVGRHFYWAIHTRFKHVIVTDHATLKWMSSMCQHNTPANRRIVRFSLEIHQTGPHLFEHRPGITNGGPDGLSRLTGTDISIDGRRNRSVDTLPRPDIWEDCRYIEDVVILQILDQEIATCKADPAWADWRDAPRSDPHLGNQFEQVHAGQPRGMRKAALGPRFWRHAPRSDPAWADWR